MNFKVYTIVSKYLVSLSLLAAIIGSDGVENYKIDAGDLLSIIVFGEEDLSLKQVRVNSNGTISYPLVGEITISGLTSREAEKLIEKMLLDGYLKKPEVNISILQYRMFYVHGEVRRPGGYQYVEGLTVEKAIALAGGLTQRASEGKITMIREKNDNKVGESVKMDIAVSPGDVITVGESIF